MEACKEYSLESSFYSAVAPTWQVSSRVGSPQCDNSIGASHAAKKGLSGKSWTELAIYDWVENLEADAFIAQ